VTSGITSRETFDQRQASAQVAAARLVAAQDTLRLAQADAALAEAQRQELMVRLARTDIRAPVGGVVSRRIARLGAVVAMAGDPLFRIIQDGAVELEGDVPEPDLARLRPGQPAQVHVAGLGENRMGAVRLVAPEVNRVTRLGRVRIALSDSSRLVIGSFARAGVEIARHEGVLVPLSAVLFQPEGARVQVVREGLVETRAVQVGLRAEGRAEITSGLAEGEQVIAVSGTFVRGGDRVTPVAGS
jgi:RND family efflux transporter MFP subunit